MIAPVFSPQDKQQYLKETKHSGIIPDHEYLKLTPQPFISSLAENSLSKYDFTILSNQEATEANFNSRLKPLQILQFASHAIIDTADPLNSRIVFNKPGINAGPGNDGYLRIAEIYGIPVSSKLTFLTGCETGSGKIVGGNGVSSIAFAFNYAGSRNMIVSLWPVDEQAVARLVDYFYEYLAEHSDPGDALYLAKRKFIVQSSKTLSNPYYWSGLVLFRCQQAHIRLEEKAPYFWYWAGALSLSAVIIALLFVDKKNKHRQINF